MAYRCYLFGEQFPTPAKLTMKIKGRNSTISLLNDGEINLLKKPGLTEITLPLVLPARNGNKAPEYYLSLLERAISKRTPTQFIMTRTAPDGTLMFDTNMKVSVEDYSISEDAKKGLDISVDVKLKQYRDFGTKTVEIKPAASTSSTNTSSDPGTNGGSSDNIAAGDTVRIVSGAVYGGCYPPATGMKVPAPYIGKWYTVTKVQTNNGQEEALIKELYSWVALIYLEKKDGSTGADTISVTEERSNENKPSASAYTVKSGDTLWGIAKTYYGDGAQYTKIYNANRSVLNNPNVIKAGQVLTIP